MTDEMLALANENNRKPDPKTSSFLRGESRIFRFLTIQSM